MGIITKKRKQEAFTLIELLIVVAIIGLLSSIVLVSVRGAASRARDAIRQQDLHQMKRVLEAYWLENYHYPPEGLCIDSSVGCGSCGCAIANFPNGDSWDANSDFQDLVVGGQIGTLPLDPINNSTYYYLYEPDGIGEGSPACTVDTCRWTLCCRLETTGASYCLSSEDY